MNPVLTQPPSQSSRLGRVGEILLLVALAAAVVFAFLGLGVGGTPSYRDLTVENPLPYTINVDATGAKRDGWSNVGTVRRESRQTFEELRDPGEHWVFRFSYAGVDAGELVVSRDQLAQDSWRITVPAEAGERLREAGLRESTR